MTSRDDDFNDFNAFIKRVLNCNILSVMKNPTMDTTFNEHISYLIEYTPDDKYYEYNIFKLSMLKGFDDVLDRYIFKFIFSPGCGEREEKSIYTYVAKETLDSSDFNYLYKYLVANAIADYKKIADDVSLE